MVYISWSSMALHDKSRLHQLDILSDTNIFMNHGRAHKKINKDIIISVLGGCSEVEK